MYTIKSHAHLIALRGPRAVFHISRGRTEASANSRDVRIVDRMVGAGDRHTTAAYSRVLISTSDAKRENYGGFGLPAPLRASSRSLAAIAGSPARSRRDA